MKPRIPYRALLPALLLALWAGPAQGAQSRLALVIGANLGEPGEEPLRYAERDASRFADVLTRFAGVPPEDLVLLRGPRAEAVERALARLSERAAERRAAGDETVLFVYYSGHADARALHLGTERLPLDHLQGAVAGSGSALSVLVVDACRSGALTRVKGARRVEPFRIVADDRLASEGSAIITSSAAGESSQESDQLGGGIFTHHFLHGLLGAADASGDRRVTLSEAYRYAYEETLRSTSRAPVVQHPTYAFRMRGREDLVVTRLADGAGLGRLRLEPAGHWLLLPRDGRGPGVEEVRSAGGTEVLVDPGRYTLRRRTAEAVFEGRADVAPGGATVVAEGQLRRMPYGMTVRKGYDAARRSVWGGLVESEVGGPVRAGLGVTPFGAVGARGDFEAVAVELRLRYGGLGRTQGEIELTQHQLEADGAALRLFDLGDLSLGFGLRAGGGWIRQDFATEGEAPTRHAFVGRAGALVRVEYAALAALSVRLTGGLDGYVLPDNDGVALAAAPFVGLGVTVYVP